MEIVIGLALAPLLGLVFVMALPIIGFGALVWTLVEAIRDRRRPAQT